MGWENVIYTEEVLMILMKYERTNEIRTHTTRRDVSAHADTNSSLTHSPHVFEFVQCAVAVL